MPSAACVPLRWQLACLPASIQAPVSCQLDKRGGAIDDKIKKLDEELMRHKELISRARPGPAQVRKREWAPGASAVLRTRLGAISDAPPRYRTQQSSVPCACCVKRRCAPAARVCRSVQPLQHSLAYHRYESQRDTLYSQQFNVEQTSFAMASVADTKIQARPVSRVSHSARAHARFRRSQVQAMKSAAKDLKKQFKAPELNLNAIDKLSDEMADLMSVSADIQDALGRNYSVPDDINEEELLGELDSLELELSMEKESAAVDAVPSYLLDSDLPAAPVGAPSALEETAALPSAPARLAPT